VLEGWNAVIRPRVTIAIYAATLARQQDRRMRLRTRLGASWAVDAKRAAALSALVAQVAEEVSHVTHRPGLLALGQEPAA
jgi:hypothetical protein